MELCWLRQQSDQRGLDHFCVKSIFECSLPNSHSQAWVYCRRAQAKHVIDSFFFLAVYSQLHERAQNLVHLVSYEIFKPFSSADRINEMNIDQFIPSPWGGFSISCRMLISFIPDQQYAWSTFERSCVSSRFFSASLFWNFMVLNSSKNKRIISRMTGTEVKMALMVDLYWVKKDEKNLK